MQDDDDANLQLVTGSLDSAAAVFRFVLKSAKQLYWPNNLQSSVRGAKLRFHDLNLDVSDQTMQEPRTNLIMPCH